jgi:uncharacterized protein YutE (UPF0331/DUF86 family)
MRTICSRSCWSEASSRMEMTATVRRMKGLRNLLVHEYERLDDEIVFETLTHRLGDFEAFKREVLDFLRRAS